MTSTLLADQLDSITIWRPCLGFPSHDVNNHGQVRSSVRSGSARGTNNGGGGVRNRPVLLKPVRMANGYLAVRIAGRMRYVHVLVMEAFHPRPVDATLVRHDDGDPADNRLHRLTWGNAKSNAEDMIRHGRSASQTHGTRSKLTAEQVREIRDSKLSLTKLADLYGVATATIWNARNYVTWKHVAPEVQA